MWEWDQGCQKTNKQTKFDNRILIEMSSAGLDTHLQAAGEAQNKLKMASAGGFRRAFLNTLVENEQSAC